MKILFLSTRRDKPSFRFRIEAAIPFFTAKHQAKVLFLPKIRVLRWLLYPGFRNYDVVLIQKRLFGAFDLGIIRYFSKKMVYDLDDSVMYGSDGSPCKKQQKRFEATVKASDLVICGNDFLKNETTKVIGKSKVIVIPTCIDTSIYKCKESFSADTSPVIGWSGSTSTNMFLSTILPVLSGLQRKFQIKIISNNLSGIDMKALGDKEYTFIQWKPDIEVDEIRSFDIGLMPLPSNKWTEGKCGLKALQYMASGVVTVCSPVGVNKSIIQDGKNGYLPSTQDEWRDTLISLIDSPQKREEIGIAGRRRVEEGYSLDINGPKMVSILESLGCCASGTPTVS